MFSLHFLLLREGTCGGLVEGQSLVVVDGSVHSHVKVFKSDSEIYYRWGTLEYIPPS